MVEGTAPTANQVSELVIGWLPSSCLPQEVAKTATWGEEQWRAARWAAQVHGVAPFLHRCLDASSELGRIPVSLQSYLSDQYRLNKERVLAMLDELVALLQAAGEAGIQVVPLKGSALAVHYYDDPALRPMSDLDLLVRPEDDKRLAQILLERGYRAAESTPRHRSFFQERFGQQPVYTQGDHPDNPRRLDLHTEVREEIWGIRYALTEETWTGSRKADFAGAPGFLMAPPTLLQHLLIHTTGDIMVGRMRWIQLFDIALVSARLEAGDWQRVVEAAHKRGEERMLYASLRLAERYLGQLAPLDVLARLAQGSPPRLRAFVERADLFHVSFCNPQTMPLADKLSLYRPGREQLMALRHRLIPMRSEMQDLYPRLARPYLTPAAYAVHGLRILVWPVRQVLRLPRLSWIFRDRGGKWGTRRLRR